jgi:hypothetical protein
MSREKNEHEARRWFRQARADLCAAERSAAAGSFEWACFQAEQAHNDPAGPVPSAAGDSGILTDGTTVLPLPGDRVRG